MNPPPGAALLLLAYGAGLVTGLAHFPDPRVVVGAACGAALYLRRGALCVLLIGLAAGAAVGALTTRAQRAGCAGVLAPGDVRLTLQLLEPGAPGMLRARLRGERCSGAIRVRWPESPRLSSGSVVMATGRWLSRANTFGLPDGMLIVRRVDPSSEVRRSPVDRIHDELAERSRALFGARAPLVDALVTGRRGEMSSELKDAFTAAGLVHLLSISGFHIGLIAGWLLLVLRLCGVRRHVAEGIAAALAVLYVAFLGWPAPAARAGWLLALVAWSRWRQRAVRPLALLAMTCLVVVAFDSAAIVDIGGWLSAAALGGAIVVTRWSDRALGDSWGWRTLAASIGATLGTAPITALAFGQVALVGMVLNFVAIPLAGAAVPSVFMALLLADAMPRMAAAFAASAGTLLAAIERVARIGAAVPGGQWVAEPGLGAVMPWLVLVGAVALAVHGRATAREAGRRVAWIAVIVAWVVLVSALPQPGGGDGRLTLHFLDVGQGDAALIRTPHGRWIAVDAGPAFTGSDAGRRVVVPMLRRQRARRLDMLVLSHAHRDHVGGAASVLVRVPVTITLDPGLPFDDPSYTGWLAAVAARGTRWRAAAAGDQWIIDGVTFRILHPPAHWAERGDDLNEDSIVLEVAYGEFRALLAGDAGFPAEAAIGARAGEVDVLKVGHHGSRGSTGEAFLARIRPIVAVISVGANRYGHPAPEMLHRLVAAGVRPWRTDHEGHVTMTTDGRTFHVRGRRTTAEFSASRVPRPRRRRARSHSGHHHRAVHSRAGADSS